MLVFYVALAMSVCFFGGINVFLYNCQILQISGGLTLVLELATIWICFGPLLVVKYALNLKDNLESYAYLYEQYNESQKSIKSLEKMSIKNQNIYRDTLQQATTAPYKAIQMQSKQIKDLMYENQQLIEQNEELKDVLIQAKKINETNSKLKEENKKLKKMIEYLKEQ